MLVRCTPNEAGSAMSESDKVGRSSCGMQLICQMHGQRMSWMEMSFQRTLDELMKKKFPRD